MLREAHIVTLQALQMLYQEAFFKENYTLLHGLQEAAAKVDRSYENGSVKGVQQAQLQSSNTLQEVHNFTAKVQTMLWPELQEIK